MVHHKRVRLEESPVAGRSKCSSRREDFPADAPSFCDQGRASVFGHVLDDFYAQGQVEDLLSEGELDRVAEKHMVEISPRSGAMGVAAQDFDLVPPIDSEVRSVPADKASHVQYA